MVLNNIKAEVIIIVPVYNTASFLAECLDSILSNTYRNFHIVAVNDKSTDNSLETLNSYQEKYPQYITVINNKENLGLPSALNIGINFALSTKAKYIVNVDSDDFTHKTLLEKAINRITQTNCDLVVWDYYKYPSGSNWFDFMTLPDIIRTTPQEKSDLLQFCYNWSKIISLELIRKHNLSYSKEHKAYEDILFHTKLISLSKSIAIIKEKLYYYRDRYGSITNTKNKNLLLAVRVIKDSQKFLNENNLYQDYEIPFLYHKYNFMFGRLREISSQNKPSMMKDMKSFCNLEELHKVQHLLHPKCVKLYEDILKYPVWLVYLNIIVNRKKYFKTS